MFDIKEEAFVLHSKELKIVIPQYRMHTQLFNNVMDNITETDALKRIENSTNHFTWMVGNMVNIRYWLAEVLGLEDRDPYNELFKDARALDPKLNYPSLKELKSQWHHISPTLYRALHLLTDEQLAEPYQMGMEMAFLEETKLNMIGMTIDRESYLLGQLGLMRRALGYEGMKYDFDSDIRY